LVHPLAPPRSAAQRSIQDSTTDEIRSFRQRIARACRESGVTASERMPSRRTAGRVRSQAGSKASGRQHQAAFIGRKGVGEGASNVDSYDISHGGRQILSNLSNLSVFTIRAA
jgi:hypothetical protein